MESHQIEKRNKTEIKKSAWFLENMDKIDKSIDSLTGKQRQNHRYQDWKEEHQKISYRRLKNNNESKRLFYTSMSLLLSRIQGYHYHLSKFHIYVLTMPKPLTVWITMNCGKFWKRWEYQTTWSASWEICMQVRKQQLELDMEQQTGSK